MSGDCSGGGLLMQAKLPNECGLRAISIQLAKGVAAILMIVLKYILFKILLI